MIGKLLCKLGLHDWRITEMYAPNNASLGQLHRHCSRCSNRQEQKISTGYWFAYYTWRPLKPP